MSALTTVARPYAKAAFAWAVENNQISQMQETLVFAAEVAKNEQIQSVLTSSLNAKDLSDYFIKICGEQLNDAGKNLVRLMATNGRLQLLSAVCELYQDLHDEHDKVIDADLVSAQELSAKQVDAIADSLELRLARKIKMHCSVDKELISGFTVKAGDLVIDSSAKGQLKRLADSLQS